MVDSLDKKILYELHWDCRQASTGLGKKLRASKQVISYRISQLEKKKIIKGYHALIDWRKLGYGSIRVYIRWRNITPEKEQEIYDHIKNNDLFMWCVKFEGDVDIGFYVWIKSIPEFSEKWFSFLEKYGRYILTQEIYESVNMVHYPMKPLAHNLAKAEKIVGLGMKESYDNTDYRILNYVTQNARMHVAEIARKVNLTPKAVIQRLRKMEKKKIILGYNALIDTNKLGYRFYKIDFFLNELSRVKEMFEYAKTHRNIVYRMRTIGGPDFEIEMMVKDVYEMKNIVNEIRSRFSDTISHYRIHRFEYTMKQIYLPGKRHVD